MEQKDGNVYSNIEFASNMIYANDEIRNSVKDNRKSRLFELTEL